MDELSVCRLSEKQLLHPFSDMSKSLTCLCTMESPSDAGSKRITKRSKGYQIFYKMNFYGQKISYT